MLNTGKLVSDALEVSRIYEGLRTDANDGEFALWKEEQLIVALHKLSLNFTYNELQGHYEPFRDQKQEL